jgi:hypothetical protein
VRAIVAERDAERQRAERAISEAMTCLDVRDKACAQLDAVEAERDEAIARVRNHHADEGACMTCLACRSERDEAIADSVDSPSCDDARALHAGLPMRRREERHREVRRRLDLHRRVSVLR